MVFIVFFVPLRRQEGYRPTAGAGAGGSDQAEASNKAAPQQRQEGDGSVQAQEGRLCLGPEELGRGAGAAAEREGVPPAGPEALPQARAHPAAAEGRPDAGRQGHVGLCAAGGESTNSPVLRAAPAGGSRTLCGGAAAQR